MKVGKLKFALLAISIAFLLWMPIQVYATAVIQEVSVPGSEAFPTKLEKGETITLSMTVEDQSSLIIWDMAYCTIHEADMSKNLIRSLGTLELFDSQGRQDNMASGTFTATWTVPDTEEDYCYRFSWSIQNEDLEYTKLRTWGTTGSVIPEFSGIPFYVLVLGGVAGILFFILLVKRRKGRR